ncbi:probable uridine nucleosidase 2 [Arachis duranensis]|uniref:Probable uridine nucleosidase 2 n=1 Tax=Arachis duranensis TaxID=130453 RepID=A0A9C6TES4_ARADU|nr:probable uridine nucleosidase 2 [Arachis duranensis]
MYICINDLNPAAEANVYFGDPDAADFVFTSEADILTLGINVIHQVVLTGSDLEKLASSNGKFAQYLTETLNLYFSYHRDAYNTDGVYLHDPTTFLAAVDPTFVTCMEGSVRVQTGGITRGLTILYNKQKSFSYALTKNRNASKDKESLLLVYLRFWEMEPSDSDFFGTESMRSSQEETI